MPETLYYEDEVYLTEKTVDDAHHDFTKAGILYDLIHRLQENETWSTSSDIDDVLSRCAENIKPYITY